MNTSHILWSNDLGNSCDDDCHQDMDGRSVGVPGELKGLAEVHSEWGKWVVLPWFLCDVVPVMYISAFAWSTALVASW